MIEYQNPDIPTPLKAIEIDKAILNIQMKLDLNLDWLSHGYGKCYRSIEHLKSGSKLYFPEVYKGGKKFGYTRVNPDNDKKGLCFFVVGPETVKDFSANTENIMENPLSVIFWVNLEKVDSVLLETDFFRQNLIKDARSILTTKLSGLGFNLQIDKVVTEFDEVYKEFDYKEDKNYLKAPYTAFRLNCTITLHEECGDQFYDRDEALKQNISDEEMCTVLLPEYDFSDPNVYACLSEDQIIDILYQEGLLLTTFDGTFDDTFE